MKGENLLLNVVCIVMALLFLGLAGLNYFSAGNFISTDSLFFTTVSGMMALIWTGALAVMAGTGLSGQPQPPGAGLVQPSTIRWPPARR